MSIENYTGDIENAHNQFRSKDHLTLHDFVTQIRVYQDAIPTFFSKNGEADGIKEVYDYIEYESEDGPEKTIPCLDITKCNTVYEEYIKGMESFIMDIANSSDEASNDKFQMKLEVAKKNDLSFIESLYQGRINGYTINQTPLSIALINVEFLIDFIPKLDKMVSDAQTINEVIVNHPNSDRKLLQSSMDMYYKSIDQYCFSTLADIFYDYAAIYNALFNDNDDSNEVITTSTDSYVLL